ncbi:serine/threonine-protein kinase [Rhodopirellula halodulae]|uniref:serine/threonine-protein kinase n=1 Tax=Rhodopirellula halodulae TaxID=2894198 RepID=UPI001E45C94D|nr:serine/threonine-protein kinase [Rhodopirellula sp. JC737]MCC9656959.1 serine/threonine protein kinase [Rhodopirellula sp. JC737]
MNPHPSDELLRRVLDEDADMQTDQVITSHVSDCQQCQSRLDAIVQNPNEIRDVLLRETCSGSLSSDRLAAAPTSALRVNDEEWMADFAVSFLEPSHHVDAMGRLGEFEVLSVIGHGGMGIVLKGFQTELNRPVAIKVMSPHLASIGTARKRFLREAQATAAIVHPNVMPILSVCESATLPYLVMPYVPCRTLQQRIDSEGPFPIEEVLRIGIQVAAALAAAHRQGLVHRDVKPANILIEPAVDRTMLTDFGLARAADDVTVTRSGVIAGTPQYMSPEQARGESIDARSDLFALGCVLYAMTVGRPPFRSETSYGILRRITDHPHRPMRESRPEIPVWLDRLVDRLLCKDSAARLGSAEETQRLMEACLAHLQQPSNPLPSEVMASKRPHIRLAILLTVLFLASIPLAAINFWDRSGATKPPVIFTRPASHPSSTPSESVAPEFALAAPITESVWTEPTKNETTSLAEIDSQLELIQKQIESLQRRLDVDQTF